MTSLLNANSTITQAVLNAIAHMPTQSLGVLINDELARKFEDSDFMRIAVLLAQKSYDEGDVQLAL
nr:hypothetical protein [Pseudoalteromonas sp. SCSIO 43201]